MRDSYYYVLESYTTLGCNISLPDRWRLIGPIIGMSGLFTIRPSAAPSCANEFVHAASRAGKWDHRNCTGRSAKYPRHRTGRETVLSVRLLATRSFLSLPGQHPGMRQGEP